MSHHSGFPALPRMHRGCVVLLLASLLVGGWGGCIDIVWPGGSGTDGNTGLNPAQFPGKRIQGDPNDTFDTALDVIFDSQGHAHLSGSISPRDDVDVYNLGPLVAGDRIIVDVGTPSSSLDSAIMIFGAEDRVAFENDDRNYDLGQYDPFLNQVIRHDSSSYYLAIAAAPLGPISMSVGNYEILVTVSHGNAVPAPASQVVALRFDGGTVTIPDFGTYNVAPFDAAEIDAHYAGKTAQLRQLIAACMRENYQGLGLDIVVVPDSPLPSGQYSSIFFGGRSSDAFGVAEDIDPYNQDHTDNALIFTDMFTADIFGRSLSLNEVAIAIGNVASHEMGHLLGLNHVADIADLMDNTGGANTLLGDQDFLNSAPLDDSIFPIGVQDDMLWLQETLGPG